MVDYKVAVVGAKGHVGKAVVSLFAGDDRYKIVEYDLTLGTKDKVNACDIAIVCVPTPSTKKGECDTSIVKEVVSWIETPLIMIKSTVAPGTTDYLKGRYHKRIVFSPEYYGESRYFQPVDWTTKGWPYIIVGGDKQDCEEALDIFAPVLGPMKNYFVTNALTAEIVKYAENIFGAMKVTWANEFYEICQRFGVNWHEVRQLWAEDPRMDKCHTSVFPKDRGFAGKCFPKDLLALIRASELVGYEPKFLKEIWKTNKRLRKEKDPYKL